MGPNGRRKETRPETSKPTFGRSPLESTGGRGRAVRSENLLHRPTLIFSFLYSQSIDLTELYKS